MLQPGMAVTQRRKLLTGAIGVATVSYMVACGGMGGGETSGNLMAPGGASSRGGSGGASGSGYGGGETSGNLMAPPPVEVPPPGPGPGTGGTAPEAADSGVSGSSSTTDSGAAAGATDSGAAPDEADAAAVAADAAVD
jgi:hypothetical protein